MTTEIHILHVHVIEAIVGKLPELGQRGNQCIKLRHIRKTDIHT